MSLFPLRRQQRHSTVDGPIIPPRGGARRGAVQVTADSALRHSAVWACLRIRADLVSTLPLDCFRRVGLGMPDVEVTPPPVLVDPGGAHWPYDLWMWASQFDLDRGGNTIGLITERNALGLPARIELQPLRLCAVFQRKGEPEHRYRIDGTEYTPREVWHERQFPVPGLPVGLDPIGYAAWTLSESLSMQEFVLDWFGGGGVPKVRLHNTEKIVPPRDAALIKERYQSTVHNGEPFVHGSDWELDLIGATSAGQEWLEGRRFGLAEVSRFLGVPVDLIEAAISAPGSVTYQSALQRNLQFLIMHLGPAVTRRESRFSRRLVPSPRYVKLNTNALLRMDPEQQAKVIGERIKARTLTPTEARALYDLPPLTADQEAEFVRLFGAPRTVPEQPSPRAAWPWEPVNPLSAAPYVTPEMSEVAR